MRITAESSYVEDLRNMVSTSVLAQLPSVASAEFSAQPIGLWQLAIPQDVYHCLDDLRYVTFGNFTFWVGEDDRICLGLSSRTVYDDGFLYACQSGAALYLELSDEGFVHDGHLGFEMDSLETVRYVTELFALGLQRGKPSSVIRTEYEDL